MATSIRAGGATHVGRVRPDNEDAVLVSDDLRLYGVADGMGGHNAGEVAAATAVEILTSDVAAGDRQSLIDATHKANRSIYDEAARDPDKRGMGTTLCVALLVETGEEAPYDDELAWVNVGDSRIYLYRDGVLSQLSTDHSLVEDMRASGQITEEEAAVHPRRNIVTRALGIDREVRVDDGGIIPFSGDRFVLCSDGLYEELTNDEMADALAGRADPTEAAEELVRLAVEHGGRDNVTVVVIDALDDGGRTTAASAAVTSTAESIDEPDTDEVEDLDEDEAKGPGTGEHRPDGPPPVAPAAGDGEPVRKGRGLAGRTLGSLLTLVILIALGALLTWWFGTRTYYVGFEGDEVAIFRGRPDGFLFVEPTLSERTGVTRDELKPAERDAVARERSYSSRRAARTFTANLTRLVDERQERATGEDEEDNSTTTSPTTTSTTTRPAGEGTSSSTTAP